MATITVSAAGGNWNSTATWVGGVIPTTSDDIAANATSGNLTVNVAAQVISANFTGYTGTLTINNTITLTFSSTGTTTIFGSGMSYSFAGTGATRGRIVRGGAIGPHAWQMLGTTPIPHVTNTGTGTWALLSNLYIENLYSTATLTFVDGGGGPWITYVSADFNMGFNTYLLPPPGGTSPKVVMNGTGTLTSAAHQRGEFEINTAGTITISSTGYGFGNATTNSNLTFRHVTGTIVNPTFRANLNGGTSVQTIDLASGTTWDWYGIWPSAAGNSTLTFASTPTFDKFLISQVGGTTSTLTLTYAGVPITINDWNHFTGITNSGGTYYRNTADIILTPGTDITVNSFIDINGGGNEPNVAQTPPIEIRSATPGVQAVLKVNTWDQYISRVRFTDINCSGGNTLYGQTLNLSNTTNITQYTLPPSGGAAGGSFTFVM